MHNGAEINKKKREEGKTRGRTKLLLRVLQRERRGGDITLDIDSEKFFKGKNRCCALLLHSIQAENSSESSSVLVFVWPQRGHTTLLVSSPAPPPPSKLDSESPLFFACPPKLWGRANPSRRRAATASASLHRSPRGLLPFPPLRYV